MRIRVERTPRGARLVQDDVVLSEILARPGPTHTLFDVLAACVAALAPGPRIAMLGFAGGGIMAPLRAMGCTHGIEAVDLSTQGQSLFRELSADWAGALRVTHADAVKWLRRRRTRYDLIVEDLSTTSPAGVVKPYASFDQLPLLIHERLEPGGIAVINLLPLPGTPWAALENRVAQPHADAAAIITEEYENRIVLAGGALPAAADVTRRLRRAMRDIESNQALAISTRTIRRTTGGP